MVGLLQVFNQPVDAELEGLYDYHLIISHPMDLGTVKKRLESKLYPSPMEFVDDVRLTFANAKKYNAETHVIHRIALMLEMVFEDWWSNMVTKPLDVHEEDNTIKNWFEDSCDINDQQLQLPLANKETNTLSPMRKKLPKPPKPHPTDPCKRQMTFEEKEKLKVELEMLPEDKVNCVTQILEKRQSSHTWVEIENDIVLDFENLDNDTLWELDRFITNYKKSRGKKTKSKKTLELSVAKASDVHVSSPETSP